MYIELPFSKSISNRLLILQRLCNYSFRIHDSSDSTDTRKLDSLLRQHDSQYDAGDGGTTFRFIMAYLSISPGEHVLTASNRMLQRPVKELADALSALGAEISYSQTEGFPPLKISGRELSGGEVSVDVSRSSQFATALLLIAPFLQKGLKLNLTGTEKVSRSYIDMTLQLLKRCGVYYEKRSDSIFIPSQSLHPEDIAVERDWSSAAFWYELVALGGIREVCFPGLVFSGIQGDEKAASFFSQLGVMTEEIDGTIRISKRLPEITENHLEFDLNDVPDMAPALIMTCFGLKKVAYFRGVQHLKYKESDRLSSLTNYIRQLGGSFELSDNSIELIGFPDVFPPVTVDPYKDHRMAMSMAMFSATGSQVKVLDESVVGKSYPDFWRQLQGLGLPLVIR